MMNQLLIQTTQELKVYLSVNADFHFDDVKASMNLAQTRYIKKCLGKFLLDKLVLHQFETTDDQHPDYIEPEKVESLETFTKTALAYLSFYLYADIGNVNISDNGFHITSTENEKPAFRWQIQDVKERLLEIGYDALEELICFLENHADDFPEWQHSDCFSQKSNLIVHHAGAFNQGYFINNKRLTFLALIPHIQYVEDMAVSSMLCDYHKELIDKIHGKDGASLSSYDKLVVDCLYKAIPRLAMAKGIHKLSIEENVFGVIQHNAQDRNGIKGFNPADNRTRELVAQAAEQEGRQYLDRALKIILSNLTHFPTYAASDCYSENSTSRSTGNIDETRPKTRDSFFQV
jgi:hypothetical protein